MIIFNLYMGIIGLIAVIICVKWVLMLEEHKRWNRRNK